MTSLFRIIRNGLQNFFRHGLLTFATVSVMSLTLFSISIIVFINIVTTEAIAVVQKQLDITIQLNSTLSQNEIDIFIQDLKSNSMVENIDYKSKQEALSDFKSRFKKRADIISFLDRLGQNPLYASITVIAKDPSNYDSLIKTLESKENNKYVKEIRGKEEQKKRIERLLEITNAIKDFLFLASIVFSFIAFLIILNTIRVTIYTRHREIVIMKLVGATYSFIILPFIVEGIFYGVFATIISVILFFPIINYASPFIAKYFDSSNAEILDYYTHNLVSIIGWQLLIGISVGVISAYLAVHRYLKENESKN